MTYNRGALETKERGMHPQKRWMLWINVLGGIAVLGSYALGLATHPAAGSGLWGGVPEGLRPLYAVGMLLAALGYLTFTYFLFFRLAAERTTIGGRFGFGLFNLLYAAMLIPSALWMPLTLQMLQQPSSALWVAIRGVLALVGLAALGLVVALLSVEPREHRWAHRLAVAGAVLFFLHTGILDAIVWASLFLL